MSGFSRTVTVRLKADTTYNCVEPTVSRIFLLSPANCGGIRAKQALSPRAQFALAAALRSADGAPLGELFSFVSGLYFRGKLTYARRFAQPPDPSNTIVADGVYVITPNAGLRSPDTRVTHAAVRAFARGDIAWTARRPPQFAGERRKIRPTCPTCPTRPTRPCRTTRNQSSTSRRAG